MKTFKLNGEKIVMSVNEIAEVETIGKVKCTSVHVSDFDCRNCCFDGLCGYIACTLYERIPCEVDDTVLEDGHVIIFKTIND